MTRKRLSDEAIISALISEGSIKGAAASLECTARTIYARMKKEDFQRLYTQAKSEILKTATAKLQGELSGAVDVLSGIMHDEEAAPQTRANCATSILQFGMKFTTETDVIARLEAVERIQEEERKG